MPRPQSKSSSKEVHANLKFVGKLLDYVTLFGRPATDDEYIQTFRKLPRNLALQALDSLAILTARRTVHQEDTQLRILRFVNPNRGPVAVMIEERIRREGFRFFQSESIAVTAAFVCKYAVLEERSDLNADALLEAIAIASQLLLNPSAEMGASIDDLLIGEVRNMANTVESLHGLIWRYFQFLEWIPSDPRVPKLPETLAASFERFTSMQYDEYSAAGQAVLAHAEMANQAIKTSLELNPLDLDAALAALPMRELVDRFVDEIAIDAADVPEKIGDGTLHEQAVNWRKAFLTTPLIEFSDGKYTCAMYAPLRETFGRILFSRLLNGYNGVYGKKTGDAFLNYFGRFLETYVFGLLKRALRTSRVINDELPFRTGDSGDNRIVDVVVIEGEDIAFVEVVAKRFNLAHTIIAGDVAWLDCDLDAMVVDKVCQLVESITRFKAGELRDVIPIDPERTRRIFPVVVVQEFPMFAAVIRRAMARVDAAKCLIPDIQIIEISELEEIEGAMWLGRRLTSILKAKTKRPDRAEMSLHNYAFEFEPRLFLGTPPYVKNEQNALFRRRMKAFERWGLPVDWGSHDRKFPTEGL